MSSTDLDLTTEARIRNAALELFGQHGPDAVSVRAVADHADVSAGLVIHYFGSKVALILAVDEYVLQRVTHYLDHFAAQTDIDDARSVLVSMADEPALFAYLARVLTQGGEAGAKLFDRLHAVSLEFMDTMIDAGRCRPVDDREGTSAWLLVADLGVLVMRHHLHRVLGVDPYSTAGLERLTAVEFDIFTSTPLFTFPQGDDRR